MAPGRASGALLACVALAPGVVLSRFVGESKGHAPCWPYAQCPEFPTPFNGSGYPETYEYTGKFPEGFIWGLGTAAYQIEGAYKEDGRGASIWDTYTGANTVGMPGSICSSAPCPVNKGMYAKGATGNVANDHYHMWKSDVQFMKRLGLKYYRFSISWPRLVPMGNASTPGAVNQKGVSFYNALIDELIANDIQPVVTLYHWDLPQALMQPPYNTPRKMGWYASKGGTPAGEDSIVPLFAAYADLCFRLFGDRVKTWVTFNEAWTFTWLGSGAGKAPGIPEFSETPKWPLVAGHNVLLAHAAAVRLYRDAYQSGRSGASHTGGRIGITNNMDWREPRTTSPADVAAAQRALEFQLGWYADPIFGNDGDYPPSMRAILGDALPKFTPEQRKLLRGSSDFFGLNHYGTAWAFDSEEAGFCQCYCSTTEAAGPDGPAFPRAESVWLYAAGWGLRKIINWVSKRYNKPDIIVTESGWSLAANTTAQGIDDPQRTYYFANYTSQLQRAISEDGCRVTGYFAWSLMDNFEWERGFTERFGVSYNDFKFGQDPDSPPGWAQKPTAGAQVRTQKGSNKYLQAVWKANELIDPRCVVTKEGLPGPRSRAQRETEKHPQCRRFGATGRP